MKKWENATCPQEKKDNPSQSKITQMLQSAENNSQEAIIIMLNGIKESVKYIGNLGRKIEIIKEPAVSSRI